MKFKVKHLEAKLLAILLGGAPFNVSSFVWAYGYNLSSLGNEFTQFAADISELYYAGYGFFLIYCFLHWMMPRYINFYTSLVFGLIVSFIFTIMSIWLWKYYAFDILFMVVGGWGGILCYYNMVELMSLFPNDVIAWNTFGISIWGVIPPFVTIYYDPGPQDNWSSLRSLLIGGCVMQFILSAPVVRLYYLSKTYKRSDKYKPDSSLATVDDPDAKVTWRSSSRAFKTRTINYGIASAFSHVLMWAFFNSLTMDKISAKMQYLLENNAYKPRLAAVQALLKGDNSTYTTLADHADEICKNAAAKGNTAFNELNIVSNLVTVVGNWLSSLKYKYENVWVWNSIQFAFTVISIFSVWWGYEAELVYNNVSAVIQAITHGAVVTLTFIDSKRYLLTDAEKKQSNKWLWIYATTNSTIFSYIANPIVKAIYKKSPTFIYNHKIPGFNGGPVVPCPTAEWTKNFVDFAKSHST